MNRRDFLTAGLTLTTAAALLHPDDAAAADIPEQLIAHPPPGFVPLKREGVVSIVTAPGEPKELMQDNRLWPKPGPAKAMLEAALCQLTGEKALTFALRRFIHPTDVVAIKVNGIAGPNMATNFELILPLVEAVLAVGVPPDKLTVYEQYPSFLSGTRVNVRSFKLPQGVKARFHSNKLATMKPLTVYEKIPTRYVRFLTEATAVINVSLIKDHTICGYTGALKNITHGSIVNPEYHHRHQADPQIAVLFAHPIVQSRVRLHITDGFKKIYDGGPLDKQPYRRILHGSVHAATDPVALDVIGAEIIDETRVAHRLPTLAKVGRHPKYIASAGRLGLGVAERERITVERVVV